MQRPLCCGCCQRRSDINGFHRRRPTATSRAQLVELIGRLQDRAKCVPPRNVDWVTLEPSLLPGGIRRRCGIPRMALHPVQVAVLNPAGPAQGDGRNAEPLQLCRLRLCVRLAHGLPLCKTAGSRRVPPLHLQQLHQRRQRDFPGSPPGRPASRADRQALEQQRPSGPRPICQAALRADRTLAARVSPSRRRC